MGPLPLLCVCACACYALAIGLKSCALVARSAQADRSTLDSVLCIPEEQRADTGNVVMSCHDTVFGDVVCDRLLRK